MQAGLASEWPQGPQGLIRCYRDSYDVSSGIQTGLHYQLPQEQACCIPAGGSHTWGSTTLEPWPLLTRWQPGAVAGTAGEHCRLASLFLQLSTFSEPLLNCVTRANQVEAPPSPGTREVEAGIARPGGQGNINFIDRHMYVHVCYSTQHACGSDQTPMIQGIKKSTVRRRHGPAGAAPTPSASGRQKLMPRARAT